MKQVAAAAMDEHLAKTIYWNYTNRVFQAALLKKCSFGYTDSSQPKVPESWAQLGSIFEEGLAENLVPMETAGKHSTDR